MVPEAGGMGALLLNAGTPVAGGGLAWASGMQRDSLGGGGGGAARGGTAPARNGRQVPRWCMRAHAAHCTGEAGLDDP